MERDKRKARYYAVIRLCTILVALVLQIILVAGLVLYLQQYAVGIYLALELFSAVVIFQLVNEDNYNRQFWIMIILALPGFGFILYYLWGSQAKDKKLHKRLLDIELDMKAHLMQSPEVAEDFETVHLNKVQISRYLQRDGFPVYKDTDVIYYPLGD
ncbi:MAG: PLD nuclease N-terminal domain-containing protein, partial [Lachnospiraceae bacterium]|nr:PLD nuclease N-terminal domain-containing protein [Lachnospiraceae bacterium]